MKIIYANQQLPDSWDSAIFLAGPTPRQSSDPSVPTPPSWRPDAIKALAAAGYDGVVFVPEDKDGTWKHNYDDQIEWEELCLRHSDVILFWIPLELAHMPAFTTNDEWGYWKSRDPHRLVLSTPPDAPKVRYQRYYAEKYSVPIFDTVKDTCNHAASIIKNRKPALRTSGERSVPLHIWHTKAFQTWHQAVQEAGNELKDAAVEWVFRPGTKPDAVFFWSLHVDVFITTENRHKTNEVVIGRPDISTILLYERCDPVSESRVVLVQEFRSPVSNPDGYVLELAGGSSWDNTDDPLQIAAEECLEETGLKIDPTRFIKHQTRQLNATTLAHQAHLFSVALTAAEMDDVHQNTDTVRGVEADSERTWTQVHTYGDLLKNTTTDWSMLGMIASVLEQ